MNPQRKQDTAGLFVDQLWASAAVNSSWLLIGLDPVVSRLPDGLTPDPSGVLEFNRRIIDATADLVAGYKPNFAFFEALGGAGWEALARTREAIPAELVALADAKRGDIGSSSELYAQAILDELGFDAVTLSPYVGREGLDPFLRRSGRGAFVLCRTSNAGSSLQNLDLAGKPVYEAVAEQASGWGKNVGLVVGATHLAALRRVRALCPSTPLLVPGVGAQGGGLDAAVSAAMDGRGGNALISVSRSIIYASSRVDFARSARGQAKAVRDSIRRVADSRG